MNENLFEVLRAFRLDAKPVSCEPYGCGHINVTYLAVMESGLRYMAGQSTWGSRSCATSQKRIPNGQS